MDGTEHAAVRKAIRRETKRVKRGQYPVHNRAAATLYKAAIEKRSPTRRSDARPTDG